MGLFAIELNLTFAGFIYVLILFTEVIDTLYLKKTCEQSIYTNKPMFFRSTVMAKRIKRILKVLLGIILVILIYIVFEQWVIVFKLKGLAVGSLLFIYMGVYIIVSLIVSKVRGEFSKRGYLERKLIEWVLVCVIFVTSSVIIN